METKVTAKEFINNQECGLSVYEVDNKFETYYTESNVINIAIEFAKIKVKEALEAAAEKADIIYAKFEDVNEDNIIHSTIKLSPVVDKQSILEAYNLEDIK